MVFANGKLLGGLDAVRNLIGCGEFLKMIPESAISGSAEDRYKKLLS